MKRSDLKDIEEQLNSSFSQDEINTILLNLFEKKIKKVNAVSLWHQYQNNRFTTVAEVNQKLLSIFDYIGYSLIPDNFESIELSPVTIFGLNRWLTPISQKNILATIRKSEVVSDTATALVPEIVKKIRAEKKQNAHYVHRVCSSHRCLRLQNFSKNPEFTAHFRVFSLATAWHQANKNGLTDNIREHLTFYLSLLTKIDETKKFETSSIRVEISHIPLIESILNKHCIDKNDIRGKTQDSKFSYIHSYQLNYPEHIENANDLLSYFEESSLEMALAIELQSIWKEVIEPLQKKFSKVNFFIDLKRVAGIGYYNGPCFKVMAQNNQGIFYPLIDGGTVDWIDKMIQSNNFKLLTSCIGSELFCRFFSC